MSQHGSATVLAAAVAAWLSVAGILLMSGTAVLGLRAQAETAADAAALAAAVATLDGGAERAAAEMAAANGASLVGCVCRFDPRPRPRRVRVVVAVEAPVPLFGRVLLHAAAAAEYDPGDPESPAAGPRD